jgi:hypothetical protein
VLVAPARAQQPPEDPEDVSNEFFVVPGTNSFAAGGSFTQNRVQVGVRLPITDSRAFSGPKTG